MTNEILTFERIQFWIGKSDAEAQIDTYYWIGKTITSVWDDLERLCRSPLSKLDGFFVDGRQVDPDLHVLQEDEDVEILRGYKRIRFHFAPTDSVPIADLVGALARKPAELGILRVAREDRFLTGEELCRELKLNLDGRMKATLSWLVKMQLLQKGTNGRGYRRRHGLGQMLANDRSSSSLQPRSIVH